MSNWYPNLAAPTLAMSFNPDASSHHLGSSFPSSQCSSTILPGPWSPQVTTHNDPLATVPTATTARGFATRPTPATEHSSLSHGSVTPNESGPTSNRHDQSSMSARQMSDPIDISKTGSKTPQQTNQQRLEELLSVTREVNEGWQGWADGCQEALTRVTEGEKRCNLAKSASCYIKRNKDKKGWSKEARMFIISKANSELKTAKGDLKTAKEILKAAQKDANRMFGQSLKGAARSLTGGWGTTTTSQMESAAIISQVNGYYAEYQALHGGGASEASVS